MYQPNHATTEIGRMRAEEMRARAERYRTIQKAKQHKKVESEEQEVPSRSRIYVYRKALGVAGLSVLMVLGFAAAALAMPAEAGPPSSVDDKHQALISKPQVREGPPSYWTAQSAPVGGQDRADIQHVGEAQPTTVAGVFGGQDRADIQHVGEAQPTTVAGVFGGQDRADIQHLGDAEPATVAAMFGDRAETGLGPLGGQERAAIQHVGEAPQPSTNLEPSSGGIDLEIVLLTGTLALIAVLMGAGAFLWFRRHTVTPA
jgi:hypothetical protein